MIAERVDDSITSRAEPRLPLGRVRSGMPGSVLSLAALLACTLAAVGCKSGTTLAKPSWWTFGGGGGDAAKLASAPSFSGDAKKPSESNKPYPTTSTPNGYVIAGSADPGSPAATPAAQSAAPIGPVVYGSTPAPAATAAATPAPAAAPAAAQTGPYATLAGETIPPPGQPLPPLAPLSATPSQAAMAMPPAAAPLPAAGVAAYGAADASAPAAGFSNFSGNAAPAASEPPAARVADARGFEPAVGNPPSGDAGVGALPSGGSRYATQSSSRFTGGGTPAAAASYGQPPAGAAFPPPDASLPAAAPPAGGPGVQPASPGLLPQPASTPVPRPDPVYRPFNTGSYRPSRTILADDAGPLPGEVRPASYEESVGGTVLR